MKTKRGNLLDVFFILVLLLGIIGTVIQGVSKNKNIENTNLEFYNVVLQIETVPYEVSDCILDGDLFYTQSGELFGALQTHHVSPAQIVLKKNGEIYQGFWQHDTMCDVTLFLQVEGTITDDGFLRGGQHALLCGQRLLLYSDKAQIYGTIIDFTSIR